MMKLAIAANSKIPHSAFRIPRSVRVSIVFAVCMVLHAPTVLAGPVDDQAAEILKATGVQGGLIVHLGCGDGKLTAALHASDSYLIHGLDTDSANVARARKYIQSLGEYGPVSVDTLNGKRLPYTDSFVNLLVSEDPTAVSWQEVYRVLAPRGIALIALRTQTHIVGSDVDIGGRKWVKTVKPWPKEIDEWTHFLHGPDNNAVARDSTVDVPRSLQWVVGPRWSRSHEEMASMSAAVSASGRIYYIIDEAPLASIRFSGDWKLVARDAFNGTLLWKKTIPSWNDHLRQFRSGPVHLPRRLVAVGEEVYVTSGLAGPVVALDGATGKTLREYQGTQRTEEILVDDGVLYLVVGTSEVNRRGGGLHERGEPAPTDYRYITAIDPDSGEQLWKRDCSKENILPLTLAVKGQRLFFQSTLGIVCFDSRSGQDVWKTPRETPARRMSFSAPTLVATDEVVLCADRNTGNKEQDRPSTGTIEWGVHGWSVEGFNRKASSTLRAYAAKDGKELWSTECREVYNSPVDIFVIDNLVWVGTGFQGLDLLTGEPKKQIDTSAPKVGMTHHRCYRNKASERFIFTGKSGIEVLSLDKGWLSNNSWVRGTCQYGIIPANGLLYAPPDACGCFLTVKAPGFFAVAPRRDESGKMPFPAKPILEKGPLYGKKLATAANSKIPHSDDWPMFRHDAARSGKASSYIPDTVTQHWSASLDGRLTQPAVANQKVFVASIDSHTLHALADDDGRELWRFTAGGRIDSAPTVYKGMVLFGSADGWVYCLGAEDGTLVWRFRAAPKERLVSVHGQLESAWPVHGSVLIQNDTLYVTAGRSSYLDGGIVLYRIEPAKGQQLSKTMLYHLDPETDEQLVPEAKFNMEGTTSDVLTGDGESVYLKYFGFDRTGKRTQETNPHLFSITGLLGEEWFVRSYWVLSKEMPTAGWGGWNRAANAFPSGRILCFDDENVFGYGRQNVAGGAAGHRADAYHLFGMSRKTEKPPATPEPQTGKKGRRGQKQKMPAKNAPFWSNTESLIVRAMVLGADRLAVAGPVDLGKKNTETLVFDNEAETFAGFKGEKGVHLRIVSATDGKRLSELKLDAMPVFDGMAAAGGRIYLSTTNGSVLCLGKAN